MAEQLNISHVTLQSILSKTAEALPEKIAITYGNQKFTYKKLDDFSSRFAGALVNCGVARGSRVALFLPNIPQFVIAYFGVLKAGGIVTVVSPLHKSEEVEWQLCDSGAQAIVVLEPLYSIVKKIMGKTLLKNVIVVGLRGDRLKVTDREPSVDLVDFSGLIEKEPVIVPIDLQVKPNEDLSVLQYTSGTTGVPRGVMLTHTNLVSNSLSFSSWIKGTSEDVFLAVLPFSHIYGMTTSMLTPICLGAEIRLLSQFEPTKGLHAIKQHKVTVICGSPTMYNMLLTTKFKEYDLSSVRVCISGASMLPSQVQERFMRAGVFLVEGYGLTEASPVTHCTPIDKSIGPVKVGSVGLALPGTESKIVDVETGHNVAMGELGELCVRGLQVMRGYWQNPVETAKVLCDGWLSTGDIAYMDSDCYVYVVDRKKDLIKHKGYSVCPRELENVLYEHPAVKMCVVVGKPDMLVGEVPKAFVVLKDGIEVTTRELVGFVNGKVAVYKALWEVEFCRELPQDLVGKVLRRALKEERYVRNL
jgi:long-chain acyl-CoA synthetase